MAGAALLILSQGLARRLDAAHYLASIVMAGMVTSLLKGFDYEEATLLLVVLVVLWRARPAFDRRAAFFDTDSPRPGSPRWPAPWRLRVAGVFRVQARGLLARALVAVRAARRGVTVPPRLGRRRAGAAPVCARAAGRPCAARGLPTDADLDDAGRAIAGQPATVPFLVYLRDKAILFNDRRTAFVMDGCKDARGWRLETRSDLNLSCPAWCRTFSSGATISAACPSFMKWGKSIFTGMRTLDSRS